MEMIIAQEEQLNIRNQKQLYQDIHKSSMEERSVDIKSQQSSLNEQSSQQTSNEMQLTFYNRSRQFSVLNPACKNTLEFPIINATTNTKHNFYNDNIANQFTQPELPKKPKYRNQRSTSFNEGSNFYQEQSKTCNLNLQSNDNDIQNKFFKYFKTQAKIRKDSLKQFSDSNFDNKSFTSNNLLKNGYDSKNSLYQHSEDFPQEKEIKGNPFCPNNQDQQENIIDMSKNYLYEEGLDTIQDFDEINRQCYFELYKNGNKTLLPPKRNVCNVKNSNNTKKSQQQELFLQGDISPWHNNQRVYHFLQGADQKKEGRSVSSSSTPYGQQNQIGFSRETQHFLKNQIQPQTANNCNNFVGLQGSESNISILNCYNNNDEYRVNASSNLAYLKTKSQLLSDPHQHIKHLQSLNNKNNEGKPLENKEVYNFSKRNSKQFQNTLRIQIKSCGQTESVLGEVSNKQQVQQVSQQAIKLREVNEKQVAPIQTPTPQQTTTLVLVDMNPLSGKENMPKFYNNLANTEAKKSVFPKIQQQFNLYKPNTIIFQSNQKYKSQFDNSSNNFNECITFLPKNLKNKILKQLEK